MRLQDLLERPSTEKRGNAFQSFCFSKSAGVVATNLLDNGPMWQSLAPITGRKRIFLKMIQVMNPREKPKKARHGQYCTRLFANPIKFRSFQLLSMFSSPHPSKKKCTRQPATPLKNHRQAKLATQMVSSRRLFLSQQLEEAFPATPNRRRSYPRDGPAPTPKSCKRRRVEGSSKEVTICARDLFTPENTKRSRLNLSEVFFSIAEVLPMVNSPL
eukprot:g71559.t1